MLVFTLRMASQLSQYISQIHAFPMAAGDASSTDPTNKTAQVIMVPLSDSPTLPSLSLLLTQGTTPSAICFQQDLLDRARRTEADWLPSALYIIGQAIEESRQLASQANATPTHVIAYSANPALSPHVVERCMQAGAIGVLQPPYESRDTLERVKKMIAFEEKSNAARRVFDDLEHTRRASVASASMASGGESPGSQPISKPALSPRTSLPDADYLMTKAGADSPSPFISDLAARRRSVDTGGLSLALQRASRHIMCHERSNRTSTSPDASGHWRVGMFREARTTANSPGSEEYVKLKTDRSASVADVGSHLSQQEHQTIPEEQDEEMAVAELLSEMYRQTRVAIEIQMEDYDA